MFAVIESSLWHFLPAPPLQVIQNPHTTGLLRPNCQENIWHVDCFQFWDQQQQFGLLREWWAHSEDAPLNQHDGYYFITNVQTLRENKNFPLNPLGREIMRTGLFETDTPKDPNTGRTIKQFYGQRIRGLMRPLKTGTYPTEPRNPRQTSAIGGGRKMHRTPWEKKLQADYETFVGLF